MIINRMLRMGRLPLKVAKYLQFCQHPLVTCHIPVGIFNIANSNELISQGKTQIWNSSKHVAFAMLWYNKYLVSTKMKQRVHFYFISYISPQHDHGVY